MNFLSLPVFLSDIELYYSSKVIDNTIEIIGDEHHHICNVMRHKLNDDIYVTDGKGNIYKTKINSFEKKLLTATIIETYLYENYFNNFIFCLPRLRTSERFEFALEKCVELGITNFVVFDSKRSVAKGEKLERWKKILTSAMKQSLRAWLPTITYCKSVSEIFRMDGIKIIFDQNAEQKLNSIYKSTINIHKSYFIFGPEGGFDEDELKIELAQKSENEVITIKLTDNRLRSETAIITAAAELSLNLTQ